MHLILVSNRMATAKSITLTWQHFFIASGLLFSALIGLSSVVSYLTVRHAAEIRLPIFQDLVRAINAEDSSRSTQFVRQNINSMAVKLGEMQAQLIRLDTLGERLAGASGVKFQDIKSATRAPEQVGALNDGRGGPLIKPSTLSQEDLQRAVDNLARELDNKTNALAVIESQVFEEQIRKMLLPTGLPVDADWNASAFGWRIDPFTGERAMHEGVDFVAAVGTPVRSAAAGVVVSAEKHPQYGNLIEIDHGKELSTRYAHASKLLVKAGSFVKRGQIVAEVGTTGRSTGPHLHFEVRLRGIAQNPDRFLRVSLANQNLAKAN